MFSQCGHTLMIFRCWPVRPHSEFTAFWVAITRVVISQGTLEFVALETYSFNQARSADELLE